MPSSNIAPTSKFPLNQIVECASRIRPSAAASELLRSESHEEERFHTGSINNDRSARQQNWYLLDHLVGPICASTSRFVTSSLTNHTERVVLVTNDETTVAIGIIAGRKRSCSRPLPLSIHSLALGVDGFTAALRILAPIGNEPPAQRVE
jgi:hypothetical protein